MLLLAKWVSQATETYCEGKIAIPQEWKQHLNTFSKQSASGCSAVLFSPLCTKSFNFKFFITPYCSVLKKFMDPSQRAISNLTRKQGNTISCYQFIWLQNSRVPCGKCALSLCSSFCPLMIFECTCWERGRVIRGLSSQLLLLFKEDIKCQYLRLATWDF